MGCPCGSTDTCGCFFDATADIVATGTGALDNPLVLQLASGRIPLRVGPSGSPPGGPQIGQLYAEQNTGRLRMWTGSRWALVWPRQTGLYASGLADIVQSNNGNVCSLSVSPPWAASDPFQVQITGRLTVTGGVAGDVWRGLITDDDGSVYSEQYFNLSGPSGYGSCTFDPSLTLPLTSAKAFHINLTPWEGAAGGSPAAVHILADDRYTILHAMAFAA